MNREEIIDLSKELARVVLDEDTLDQYYEDVLNEIGMEKNAPLTDVVLVDLVADNFDYLLPSDAVDIIALISIVDIVSKTCRQLTPSTSAALEAYDSDWRSLQGNPYFFTREERNDRYYRLVPEPEFSSSAFIPTTGTPFGINMPDNSCALIYSVRRDTDIPDWLALHISLRMLAKEFDRPSDHQDKDFAQACVGVANVFSIIGGL